MEASASHMRENDEDQALKGLLNAFGSMFTLREIASAYRQASKNSELTGAILNGMQDRTSASVSDEVKCGESSVSSNDEISEKSVHAGGNSTATKKNRFPASTGTVSSVLGKDYFRSTPMTKGSSVTTKPLKLDLKEFPEVEIWEDEAKANSAKAISMPKDTEDFLFKMLGDGFQIDRDAIQKVLDRCGYDLQKSMDKLLDMSVATLDKRNGHPGEPSEKLEDIYPKLESSSCQNKSLRKSSSGSNGNRVLDTQKEVLASLFNVNERSEESPVKTPANIAVKRTRAVGEETEPPTDPTADHKIDPIYSRQDYKDDEGEEDSYQILRKAVKEYRSTMKEYYKAAAKAYAEGDFVRAGKLMEKGHIFNQKAREADEESAEKIFETRYMDTQEVFTLDLHADGAKEAIRLLKCYLSSLSSIPSIKYLKVIMETNDEDITKGARKRRILKLLEKESISWIEEGTAGTILICLEKINRKCLSFATNSTL